MTATAPIESALELPCYVAGEPVLSSSKLDVHYPYTGEVSGIVSMLGRKELDAAITAAVSRKLGPDMYSTQDRTNRGLRPQIVPTVPKTGQDKGESQGTEAHAFSGWSSTLPETGVPSGLQISCAEPLPMCPASR